MKSGKNIDDVIVPPEKVDLVDEGYAQVEEVLANYNMGFITNNERYNQVIDIWTHANSKLTQSVMQTLSSDKQGFNSVYMMLDSGARGSREQIRQLGGMRGLMAKPQKNLSGSVGEIIEIGYTVIESDFIQNIFILTSIRAVQQKFLNISS